MSVTLYNFDNFSDASVSSTETNALLTNKSSGDNAYTIINNMGVTSITFISSSTLNGPGSYAKLADKQVGDVLLVHGTLTTQAQHDAGWKSAVEGYPARSAAVNWKIVTSNDLNEVITGSGGVVAYASILRSNAPINRVSVNAYTLQPSAAMRTISYSGSLYTQKKPAVAFAYYTSVGNAFQDFTKQFSAEVGDGAGDQNSMTYLEGGSPSTGYAKIRTYDKTGSLRDINVKYDGGGVTLYYGSLHFD